MAERYIPEHRRTNWQTKNRLGNPDALRRNREDQVVEIRKQRREENLAKRRGIAGRGQDAPGAALGAAADSDDDTAGPGPEEVRIAVLHTAPSLTDNCSSIASSQSW